MVRTPFLRVAPAAIVACLPALASHAQTNAAPSAEDIEKRPVAEIEAAMKGLSDPDQPYPGTNYTPLMAAAAAGRADVVAMLLAKGALPNRVNEGSAQSDDCTPLYYAAHGPKDDRAVLEALIQAGALVEGDQRCLRSPLAEAAVQGKGVSVRFLRSKGANPNALSRRGRTPLTDVLTAGGQPLSKVSDVVDALLGGGADIDGRDALGETPLVATLHGGTTARWVILLDRQADPRITDNLGKAAASYAPADQQDLIARFGKRAMQRRRRVPPPVFSSWPFGGQPLRIGADARVAAGPGGLHVLDPAGKKIGSAPAALFHCFGWPEADLLDIDGDGVRDYSVLLESCADIRPRGWSLYLSLRGGRTNLLVNYDESKRVFRGNTEVPDDLRPAVARELARRKRSTGGASLDNYRLMAKANAANGAILARLQEAHAAAKVAYKAHKPDQAVRAFGNPLANLSEVDPSGRDDQVTTILNDYGFFLAEAGMHESAINVLQLVIARAPDRAVAYLNLADTEYARGDKTAAAGHYHRYAALMREAGRGEKIPARVAGRTSGP